MRSPRAHQHYGARAEQAVAKYLERRGYEILASNFRTPGGEIDLVARQGERLCFVEVRARSTTDFGRPAETIGRAKRRRIVHAARVYLSRQRAEPIARFDVAEVVGDSIEYIENAFDVDD